MIRIFLVLTLSVSAASAYAETVYKSVDEQGNTVYSAEPPPGGADFQTLEAAPEPGEEAVRESEDRQQKLEQHLDEAGKSEADQAGQSSNGEAAVETGSAAVMADWRETKKVERQRAFWGEKWPIHHPRDR